METTPSSPASASASDLCFERLQLPRDLGRVRGLDDHLAVVLRALLGEAAAAADGLVPVIAGMYGGKTVVLAHCFEQLASLPLRLGEKILWEPTLPALRLPPIAQDGIRSDADARALLAFLHASAPQRALVLTEADTAGHLFRAVMQMDEKAFLLARNEPDTHLFHRFADSYDAFFKLRSSKYRNQLRKNDKVFAAYFLGETQVREYRKPSEVAAFLTAAKAINRKTYQFRMFGETVDDDAASVAAACLDAEAGNFRSFILWHDGQPVCFVLGRQRANGMFEYCKTGYDPARRDGEPGIQTTKLMLQMLYADDKPCLVDFGSGDSFFKRLFSNEARTTASPMVLPRIARFRLAAGLYETSTALNTGVIRVLERTGAKSALKRMLRRGGSSL